MARRKQQAPAADSGAAPHGANGPRRILVGLRLEPSLIKVMKGLAELHDCTLGELVETVMVRAMEGQSAFAETGTRVPPELAQRIEALKQIFGMDYDPGHFGRKRQPAPRRPRRARERHG